MKRSKGFLVLICLSLVAMSYRLYQTFFQKIVTLNFQKTGDSEIDQLLRESQDFALNQATFYQNDLNKWLVILLLAVLILVFFLYYKGKFLQAKWLYLIYIVGQFVHSIYKFIGFKALAVSISFEDVHQFTIAAANAKFYGSVVLFIVYTTVILLSLYKGMRVSVENIVI